MEWEDELAALWASLDNLDEDEFQRRMAALAEQMPAAIAAFERGAAFDSTGHSDKAVPLYREALAGELDDERRRRAVIQMASSLRNLGQVEESVALLTAERERTSDHLDDAVAGFLALALVDSGHEREAASIALDALAPHLPRYQRSLGNYARELVEGG